MDILATKAVILLLMFLVTFICSMVPLFFIKLLRKSQTQQRRSMYQTILSLMSCGAGGVFMGTCILDLFPDVQEQIDILMSKYDYGRPFPVAEFIVVLGFLIVLTMEQIVLDYKEKSVLNSSESSRLLQEGQLEQSIQHDYNIAGISDQPDLTSSMRSETGSLSGRTQAYGSIPADSSRGHSHNVMDDHDSISSHSTLRSILLLFALSLHSVFEGMAVGLQSTIENVVALFVVVILHKGTIALSLSINMVQSKLTSRQIIWANLFFCLTAPIGVGVGMGIMEMQESLATNLASGVLQGIACGTFLYVTFFEVLPHEMNNGENRLLKLACVILGFSIVCAMLYIDPDSEKYRCYRQ